MKNDAALREQFHQLIEEHKGILLKVARVYCRYDDNRQDLLQEMMLQIWKSLHNYNDQYKITTWLYRIALNVAISFYRKNRYRQHISTQPFDNFLLIKEELDMAKQEQLHLLDQFIAELNDVDKAIILLYLEDRSHAEIADILGLSVTNVGTKLGRIKDKLRKRFSQVNQ